MGDDAVKRVTALMRKAAQAHWSDGLRHKAGSKERAKCFAQRRAVEDLIPVVTDAMLAQRTKENG